MEGSADPEEGPIWCYKKRETDALGGVKILLGPGGGSVYGYPHYRSMRAIPTELNGIDPDVWAGFFVGVSGIQGRRDGKQCMAMLGLVAGWIVFLVILPTTRSSLMFCSGMLLMWLVLLSLISHSHEKMQQSLEELCRLHNEKFAQQGWSVSCHVEKAPPRWRRVSTVIWVAHFLPLTAQNSPSNV